jgi:hypothetical protein
MQLSNTSEYRTACEAMNALKEQGADPDLLRSLARFLILSHDATLEMGQFPYVGTPGDPRDADVVAAYRDAWQDFVLGED